MDQSVSDKDDPWDLRRMQNQIHNRNPMEIIRKFVDISIEHYASMASPAWDPMYIDEDELTDPRFVDEQKPIIDGTIAWKPTESFISDTEISELEEELKHPLPDSFKKYLRYKNFYDMDNLSAVWMFRPLIPTKWKKKILDATFNGYPREFIYDKGLIPFADYSDWGLTCFNTNQSTTASEYEIVIWDHDQPMEFEVAADNFTQLLTDIVDNFENNKDEVVIIG